MGGPSTNTGEPSRVDEIAFPNPGEYSEPNVLHMSDLKIVVIRKQTNLDPAIWKGQFEHDGSDPEEPANKGLMIPNPFEERNWPHGWRQTK
jgi:hypothetical protein